MKSTEKVNRKPIWLAILSFIVTLFLIWVEVIILFLGGMILAEATNTWWQKTIAGVVMLAMVALTFVLPVIALRFARRVRKNTESSPKSQKIAFIAQIVAVTNLVLVVANQIFWLSRF